MTCAAPTWDIAAGDYHSLLSQNKINEPPYVYYCGQQTELVFRGGGLDGGLLYN